MTYKTYWGTTPLLRLSVRYRITVMGVVVVVVVVVGGGVGGGVGGKITLYLHQVICHC